MILDVLRAWLIMSTFSLGELAIAKHTAGLRTVAGGKPSNSDNSTATYVHSAADVKGFKRQKCSVCQYEEKFNFDVPDGVWKCAVPEEYRKRAVCLACFDGFARRNQR